jgi:hypothetical protein
MDGIQLIDDRQCPLLPFKGAWRALDHCSGTV